MAIWEEKKMKKKTVPTRHAILMAGIQEEKRQAQLKEAYGITEEVTVVEKKSRTAQLLRVLVNAIFVMMRCVALVVLIVLAIIGVATLIYPNMRAAGLETWLEIETQLAEYLCKESAKKNRHIAVNRLCLTGTTQFVKEYSPKSLRNREGFWYNRRKPPREAPSWKSTPKTPAAKQWLLT